jgi:hypothetical protein
MSIMLTYSWVRLRDSDWRRNHLAPSPARRSMADRASAAAREKGRAYKANTDVFIVCIQMMSEQFIALTFYDREQFEVDGRRQILLLE